MRNQILTVSLILISVSAFAETTLTVKYKNDDDDLYPISVAVSDQGTVIPVTTAMDENGNYKVDGQTVDNSGEYFSVDLLTEKESKVLQNTQKGVDTAQNNAITENKDTSKSIQATVYGNGDADKDGNVTLKEDVNHAKRLTELAKGGGILGLVDENTNARLTSEAQFDNRITDNSKRISKIEFQVQDLYSEIKRLDGAVAAAAAVSSMVTPKYYGDTVISVGTGNYNNTSALALGVTHNVTEQTALRLTIAASDADEWSTPIFAASANWAF